MKIDLNKKYRYRNGGPARILCVDAPSNFPVISLNKYGEPASHTDDGRLGLDGESKWDLIEVREPLECWVKVTGGEVNVYAYPETSEGGQGYRLFREVID